MSFTYDEIGNLRTLKNGSNTSGYYFNWGKGRQLESLEYGETAESAEIYVEYGYNAEGIRISRTFNVGGLEYIVDGDKIMSLSELAEYSCYMDEIYPLFSTDVSVKDLVIQGIEKSKKNITYMDIKNIFDLDDQRFERPLSCVGNEVFRAMAAVGISHNKEIFCFPWLSYTRYKGYHKNLWGLMDILKSLDKIAIVPVGKKD